MPAPVLDCEYNNQAMFEMTPMMEEVLDQPRALADVRKYYTSPGAIPFSTLRRVVTHWPPTVVFTGMGSSLFAAYPAQAFLTSVGIRALVWETAELLHHHLRILKPDTLLVIVSQSGETVEVTRLLEHLPKRVGVLGVVNVESSTLGRRANVLLPMLAGRQKSVSTRTYTTSVPSPKPSGSTLRTRMLGSRFPAISVRSRTRPPWARMSSARRSRNLPGPARREGL